MMIVIDSLFSKFLPPLSAEELTQLEKSLLAEGCREPLVVWRHDGQDILIDGHHRYELGRKHKIPLKFQVLTDKQIPDRDAAVEWIIRNQLARRNLPEGAFAFYLGRLYNAQKPKQGGTGANQHRKLTGHDVRSAQQLAKEHGVNERTVRRAGKFADAVDKAKQIDPDVEQKVLRGEVGRKDLMKKADTPKPPEQEVDADGRVIPEHLRHRFEIAEEIKHLAREVSRVRTSIEQSIEVEAAAWSQVNTQDVIAKLKYVADSMRLGAPYVVCVYCGGIDSCQACKGTGFLSKARVRCAPKELRTGKAEEDDQ